MELVSYLYKSNLCVCFTVLKFKIDLSYNNYVKFTIYESNMQKRCSGYLRLAIQP
jgi:hypothetical protein